MSWMKKIFVNLKWFLFITYIINMKALNQDDIDVAIGITTKPNFLKKKDTNKYI